jgi:hypothetical protein
MLAEKNRCLCIGQNEALRGRMYAKKRKQCGKGCLEAVIPVTKEESGKS